ncbi:tetratricopeptide repeat protein [Rhodoferax sp.]|uniref:tetratricopeptide repeat protein n=1 Tax=Rhodoferax sp. TaxID=50421 RepID=UPI00261AA433|nr:tetratricopeptide repeat protein [Rhodoferax sp.]MDD2925911.1 tetratricopeptide repeat protein [Rhodoferax sp.]
MDYYEWMRFFHALLPLMLTCTLSVHAQTPPPTEPVPQSSAMDASLFYQLLLGELSVQSEEPGTAFSLMLDAARKTNDPSVFKRAVQIALQARSGESALQAAKAWSQANPASRDANRFVLQILLGLNRSADTLEPLKRELALTPQSERRELIWSIPVSYERAGDRQAAASTVQKALAGVFNDPEVGATAWASVGRLWLHAGDKAAALNAATKGLAITPESEHPALLALSLMDADTPEAENLVKKHLSSARSEFRMAYIKALLNVQRLDDVKLQLQAIKTHSPNYADAWLIDGALALQAGNLPVAEQQFQHYLDLLDATPEDQQHAETQRGRSQAFLSLAEIAHRRKDLPTAESWLQRVNHPDDILRAQIRRASLIAQQGRLEEAISLIQSQTERNETDARLKQSAEIQLLRDLKQFERARDTLKAAMVRDPNDLDLVYDLAMVNERLGEMTEMERLLRHLIEAKPQDPQAYNALGYSLADHNLRLPEAIELITKALELSPKDPFITDSLAWAEFRSGNHETALRLLQSAFKDKPDAEIAAHLGEVLWAVNRRDEAIQVFREGLKLNPDNETLTETIRRLRVPL